ncbi:MAG: 16S rRNA (guanine(527)-N(7))-methyltransferase RsmG [Salinispira sp.]
MTRNNERLLAHGLRQLTIYSDSLLISLKRYIDEILLWNSRAGLVKATERELVVRHILDSAAAFFWFGDLLNIRRKISVADLGSGAGLPGIVLALTFRDRAKADVPPEFRMHLIEKQQRRCAFLHNIIPILGLKNTVHIHELRVEDLAERRVNAEDPVKRRFDAEDLSERRFDVVTSRAFRPFTPEQCRLQMRLLNPGGWIAAYKGRRERILENFGGPLPDQHKILSIEVPFLHEDRHLLVLKKIPV